jgi:hypothetical protein
MTDPKLIDILARLVALQESTIKPPTPPAPQIDPTVNAKDALDAAVKRQDDLREQAEKFQDKLAVQRGESEKEAKRAEAGRIDALLVANTNNVALALEKQGAQAQAQDKRIAALEQNQYQGVGATGQRGESRQFNQWLIGVIALMLGVVLAHFWK